MILAVPQFESVTETVFVPDVHPVMTQAIGKQMSMILQGGLVWPDFVAGLPVVFD